MTTDTPPLEYAKADIQTFDIDDIHEADYNPRRITNDALKGLGHSLEEFGLLTHPVLNIWGGKNTLVGGHQRYRLLKDRGQKTVDCVVVNIPPEEERFANLTLNNPAIQGTFVPELTRAVVARLKELNPGDSPLFSRLRLGQLVRQVVRNATHRTGVDDVVAPTQGDEDVEPTLGKKGTSSTSGHVYRLGRHRLYCGSFQGLTGLDVFETGAADLTLTYLGSPLKSEFLSALLTYSLDCTFGAAYIAAPFDVLASVHRAFHAAGGHWSTTILAYSMNAKAKAGMVYRDVTTPILYGWREGTPHQFFGDRSQSNLWPLKRPTPAGDFPVEAAVQAVVNGTRKDGVVFDPYTHKGASFVASEKTGRQALGIAATPSECDRARARWARFVHGQDCDWAKHTPQLQ